MNEEKESVEEILADFAGNNPAAGYTVNPNTYKKPSDLIHPEPVKIQLGGDDIFIVSDLHIASGRNTAGVYQGTENFFADNSFYRFVSYADKIKKSDKAALIINGDIFDFLRVTDYPGKSAGHNLVKKIKTLIKSGRIYPDNRYYLVDKQDEFKEWSEVLGRIGISKTEKQLEENISAKEKKYGLKTDAYKSVYKLIKIRHGHPVFFLALKEWIEKGNKLILLKGNHDLELYWPEVRNYIRLIIAEEIAGKDKDPAEILKRIVIPNLLFIDDSVEINNTVYIEHGHRYDKFTLVLNGPVLKKIPEQLNIPFGSFFNRYLLNRIELFYPFLDNVRPTKNVLPILIKENFPMALKVLFFHIPVFLRIITTNFRYLKFILNRVFWLVLSLLIPFIILWIINPSLISDLAAKLKAVNNLQGFLGIIINEAKNLGLLILPYFLARLTAWLQLEEPSSLNDFAEKISDQAKYKIIVMGHTHNPGEYLFKDKCRFYNTGTWIPIIENSTADIREDKTYTFLRLIRTNGSEFFPACGGLLQRWNDDAGRAEPVTLIKRK